MWFSLAVLEILGSQENKTLILKWHDFSSKKLSQSGLIHEILIVHEKLHTETFWWAAMEADFYWTNTCKMRFTWYFYSTCVLRPNHHLPFYPLIFLCACVSRDLTAPEVYLTVTAGGGEEIRREASGIDRGRAQVACCHGRMHNMHIFWQF